MLSGINSTKLGDIYVRREADIVKVRDRVRRLAREMDFDPTTQIKITTAVSEITRNIYEYAKAGIITPEKPAVYEEVKRIRKEILGENEKE